MNRHGCLQVAVFVEPLFQENGYLLSVEGEREAWVIDPGLPPQPVKLAAAIRERNLQLQAILLTHCHVDHIAGIGPLREQFAQAQIWCPRDEQDMLGDAEANMSAPFGYAVTAPPADRLLAPGDELTLGRLSWRVLDVSGHSPGGVAYYSPQAGVVFTGDALFAGSIGRYDFPGSSGRRLLSNVRRHLLSLPPDTVVYSGHGPSTTIGEESESNPFLEEGFVG